MQFFNHKVSLIVSYLRASEVTKMLTYEASPERTKHRRKRKTQVLVERSRIPLARPGNTNPEL